MRWTAILWAPLLAFGQVFDAASVRPSATPAGTSWMTLGGPGTKDPGRINYTGVPLQGIVMNAYGLTEEFEISCPAWMKTVAFNIVATMPRGTTQAEFRLMLQNLLRERFRLALHRETRGLPGYELTAVKNGVKMKESAPANVPGSEPAKVDGHIVRSLNTDRNGQPELPPGAKGLMTTVLRPPLSGFLRISARMQSLPEFLEFLVRQRRTYYRESRPIVDKAGLKGLYDFNLDFVRPAPPATAGQEPGVPADPGATPEVALEEQLGLKLEAKRVPVDVLVVDFAERVPTEN